MVDPRVTQIIADANALDADLSLLTQERDSARAALDTCQDDSAGLLTELEAAEAALSASQAELTACNAIPKRVFRFAGDPGPGMAYVGCAYGGNTDPAARETSYGRPLGTSRTYWRHDQVASAVTRAGADLAKKRLPWISFKLSTNWTDAAAGAADAWATDLADRLAALPGPVWLTIHHEPEGDEGTTAAAMSKWVAVQRRLSPLMARPNIAFWIVLTGWSQFFGTNTAYHLANLWPGDDVGIAGIGIDPYNWYGTAAGKPMEDMEAAYWIKMQAFAKAHNVAWAVSETGYTAEAHTANPKWLQQSFDRMVAHGGVAFSYFDLNDATRPTWTWQLDAARLAAFKVVINQQNSATL